MSYLTNWIVDRLAVTIFRGDLINFLPAGLRLKARANLDRRTLPVAKLTGGSVIYQTYNAKEWKEMGNK
jgi:hypothetical protein